MKTEYFKEYSHNLNRDMEFKVYGHAGKPVLIFPSQDGRFFQYEDFGMIDACKHFIDNGQIQLFCADGIDLETWSATNRHPHDRVLQHERYYHYIVYELVPRIFDINTYGNGGGRASGILTSGCSMGGFHSANFFFRRPRYI